MMQAPAPSPALPIGAHLVSPRWGYSHHGIHVGQGRVIHYAGFNRPFIGGPVEEVSLERFTRGRPLQVKAWSRQAFVGEAAVERARSRIGERRYRLWSNNCEHFATWCISGQARSEQVDAWLQPLRTMLKTLARPLANRRRWQHRPT